MQIDSYYLKKLFVGKLLFLCGVYPGEDFSYVNLFSKPIDNIMKLNINLEYEKKIDTWLYGCVYSHPCVKEFKTIHFLKKNGAL
jgi:hypothetical protein